MMNKTYLTIFGLVAILAMLMSGCNTIEQEAGETIITAEETLPTATAQPLGVEQVEEATATATLPTEEAPDAPSMSAYDMCKNPIYPVVNGAVWTYTGPDGEFTNTIETSAENVFTIVVESGQDTFLIQGKCEGSDINLLQVPGESLSYSGEDGESSMSTLRNEGVTLPGDIQQGDQWSQEVEVQTSGSGTSFTYVINTAYEALGYEQISVPAGNFNALKIQQSGSMGGPEPMVQTLWYAEGVGLVKTEVFLGDMTVVIELVGYEIP